MCLKLPSSIFLYFLLLFTAMANMAMAQSDVLSKKVSLNYESTPLKIVLNDLQERYDLNFTYFNNIPENQEITLQTKREPLGKSLATIFQKAGLKYAVTEHSVVIQQKFKQLNISGQITDKETGDPLAFATVSIKEKPIGIVTNPEGKFGFLIPEEFKDDTLYVSMLGYQNYEVDLSKLSDDDDLKIVLVPKERYLDEVDINSDKVFVQSLSPLKKAKKKGSVGLFKSFTSRVHYTLDASNLNVFKIDCGAGSLQVLPNIKTTEIEVDAEIITTSISAKENQKYIDKYLRLYLEEKLDTAHLRSYFNLMKKSKKGNTKLASGNAMGTPISKINLTVKVPPELFIYIDDNSGDLSVEKLKNDLNIRDGSGNMLVDGIEGDVYIDDGSGGLEVRNITGDLKVYDSSGEVIIQTVAGGVFVKDKSGGILLKDITADPTANKEIYVRDRSGRVDGINLSGDLEVVDSSGGIDLNKFTGELIVKDASGGVTVNGFEGKHKIDGGSGGITINGKDVKKKKKRKK